MTGTFFKEIESVHPTHVAANPCGSPHFSAQNAASPFGLPLLPAKSLAAPALFACKRAHDVPACYQLFADFPTFPQPGTGRARCPACSSFSQPPKAGVRMCRFARLALSYSPVKLVQYGLISLGLITGDGNKIGFAQARFPRDRLHIPCDVIRIYIFIIGSHIFRYDPELHG